MSRIGKLPINIPEKVEVNYRSDITVKGKFGTLQTKVPSNFITQDGSQLKVIIKSKHVMFEHYMVYTER
jgi:ribosomal protein L6P/L9E